ncbi:MAG: hypothetical protein P8Q99_05205 [Paracoccaceae bacterium]|nr:hypothetical protein [Paracoccaceae bacterium]
MKEQLDVARALIKDGQAEQTYTLLAKLHEKKPQGPAPLIIMAHALIEMDKLDEAQQSLEQALKLRPENGAAMIMLQRLLQTMGDEVGSQKLALKMVNNATEASATVTRLYTHLLRNRANASQKNEIDAALRHAIDLVKDGPKLLRILLDQAVTFTDPAILSELVKTSDKSDVHRQDLAMALHQKYGEYAPILAGLRANFTGTRSAEDALKAGQALLGVGRLATGRRYLRLCLHKWPENTPIFFVYVHALIRSGRYETAINVLRDRLNLDAPTGFLRLSNQLLVTLCLNRNFEDAQALREKLGIQDDANRTALGLYLHQIIETGDLSLAMAESQALRARASTRSQAHWGLTLHS